MGCVFIFVWEKYTKTTLGPFQSTPYNNYGVKKKEGGYAPIPLNKLSVVINLCKGICENNLYRSVVDCDCSSTLCTYGINKTL